MVERLRREFLVSILLNPCDERVIRWELDVPNEEWFRFVYVVITAEDDIGICWYGSPTVNGNGIVGC